MHNIRWDDLQFVRTVAEQGSLSAAARLLGVNHATVLRRITALEKQLGLTLFQRPPGGYRVRAEMREFLDAVQSMGQSADRLERIIPAIGKGLEGPFRVTTTDSLADAVLPNYLKDLSRLHPKLAIELVVSNQHMDVSRPAAEITIRPALSLTDGLTGHRAATMTFGVYGHPGLLRPGRATQDACPWLGVDGQLARSPVARWLETNAGPITMRADSFLALTRMAEAGLGLAMLPKFLGERSPELNLVSQITDRPETGIWVATHPDLAETIRVQTIMSFFSQALANDPMLHGG